MSRLNHVSRQPAQRAKESHDGLTTSSSDIAPLPCPPLSTPPPLYYYCAASCFDNVFAILALFNDLSEIRRYIMEL